MSLFDEFDKLSANAGRRRQRPSNSLPELGGDRSVVGARSLTSKITAEPSPSIPVPQASTNTSLNQAEYSQTRSIGSFRFSLSRGGVIASIAGILVAAALLFLGGYVTAYVVYKSRNPGNVLIAKVKPSPEFEKNHKIDQSEEPESLKATHRPLEVVMSPETSGGKAVVAPEPSAGKMRGSLGKTSIYPQSVREKDTNQLSNSEELEQEPDGVSITKIPGNRKRSGDFVVPKSKPERLLTAPSNSDSVSDFVTQSAPPKNEKANQSLDNNGKRQAPVAKETGVNTAASPIQQEMPHESAYSGNFGYSLQLAAFSSKINASQMMKELEGFVPTARIDKGMNQSGQALYFLRVGYVEKREEAVNMANRLSTEKKINSGYIIRVRAPDVVP
ncbi:MAG: SPOR domain-containing protein [Pseudomonadota bacterium]|nr:SPOR domain-containing protein [Pseudomonadota bacterium]